MILPRCFIFFFLLMLLLPAGLEAADFVVVVNNENPLESLHPSEVKKIFLGKKTFWANGQGIDILLQNDGDVHRSFLFQILHKSPRQLAVYWKKVLFSGKGLPPRKHPDDQSMKKAIAANPQAIGYIDVRQLDETVKAVTLH